MNKLKLYDETRKTNIKSTVFTDGMVVTADDLDSAMRYPIDLFQTLVRAYFGCGIVCGFEVHKYPKDADDTFCVKIEPGVALDCYGHPLQLCECEKIDLTPDPCACEDLPECVCIAIRRDTMPEAPREDGGDCDNDGKPRYQYGRERELVRIKVFKSDELPKTLCARPKTPSHDECQEDEQEDKYCTPEKPDLADCMKTCPDCNCCGEAWVLLACIKFGECGVEAPDMSCRKYIKPIECCCPPTPERAYTPKEKPPPEDYPKEESAKPTSPTKPRRKARAKRTAKTST